MALKQISQSTGACVTLDEVKSHLKIETTAEDTLLAIYVKAAENEAENRMRRAVSTQTWDLVLDSFPDGGIEIPRPPISSSAADVTITYYDSSGNLSTLASTAYTVDSDSEPGWIVPSDDNEWPETYDMINAVRVRYGCGLASTSVPNPIKIWVLMRTGAMFNNREAIGDERTKELPRSFVDGLLDPYIVHQVD